MGGQSGGGEVGAASGRLGFSPVRSRAFCRRRGTRDIKLLPAQAQYVSRLEHRVGKFWQSGISSAKRRFHAGHGPVDRQRRIVPNYSAFMLGGIGS